jgi:alpha-glucosidase (family GH31 glycosyl hydrolase)
VFLKNVHSPKINYIAAVWPGKVYFVDYLHPNASLFWKSQLDRLYELIPFSGVWLDMNEPSNFEGN